MLASGEAVSGTEVKTPGRVLDALKQLDGVQLNAAAIEQTKIVQAVKKLIAVDNTAVAAAAKALLLKWKKIMLPGGSGASTPQPTKAPSSASSSAPGTPVTGPAATPSSSTSGTAAVDTKALVKALEVYYGGNMRRQKPAEMLSSALMTGEQALLEVDLVAEVASNIEKELFDLAKGSTDGDEYKNKIRSLTSNFRQNQQLRVATLTEQLPAKRVCLMTAIELASDEKRREIQALYKEIVADSMEAKGGDAVTDMFQCGKCKKRKTTYRQAQTRSADEPMTTFVTCLECGNRWKFS